jgi:hypothetical protein
MKLFPPNPRNVEAATSYVKRIPRRSGISDYQAIREAGIGQLVVAPMFFVFMATSVDDLTIVAILLSIGLGYRTLSLLDLFPNTDVPSPIKEKCDTDKSTLKK